MFSALRLKWVEKQADGAMKDKGFSFHLDGASVDEFLNDLWDDTGRIRAEGIPHPIKVTPGFYRAIKQTQHGLKKWNLA